MVQLKHCCTKWNMCVFFHDSDCHSFGGTITRLLKCSMQALLSRAAGNQKKHAKCMKASPFDKEAMQLLQD